MGIYSYDADGKTHREALEAVPKLRWAGLLHQLLPC